MNEGMKDSTYCRNKKSIHSDKTAHVGTRRLRCRWVGHVFGKNKEIGASEGNQRGKS